MAKGSIHPPRMIIIKYQGLEQWTNVLGIVGKGITFDTGGISLKRPKINIMAVFLLPKTCLRGRHISREILLQL